MNIVAIDCSHRDRPRIGLIADELVIDRRGTVLIGCRPEFTDPRPHELEATSIAGVREDLKVADEIILSHDWVVKVIDS